MTDYAQLYEKLYTIRSFETLLLDKFSSGIFPGTTHTSLGHEANAVGVLSHVQENDVVVSNHRCHGHFLAYGGDPTALYAELMGKSGGIGRCGRLTAPAVAQLLLQWRPGRHTGNGGRDGLCREARRPQCIVFDFMGDGTLGEGIVYECLNMISLWSLPILIVLENNHIAQTTPTEKAVAGSMTKRFEAFGIPTTHLDTHDVTEMLPVAGELTRLIRRESSPQALVIETARLGTHSKGDDTRDPTEVELLWTLRDPVEFIGLFMTDQERAAIQFRILDQIQSAFDAALAMEGRSA